MAQVSTENQNAQTSRLYKILVGIQKAKDDAELFKDDLNETHANEINAVDGSKFVTLFYCLDEVSDCIKHFIAKVEFLSKQTEKAIKVDGKENVVKAEPEEEFDYNAESNFQEDNHQLDVGRFVKKEEIENDYDTNGENIVNMSAVKDEYNSSLLNVLYPKEDLSYLLPKKRKPAKKKKKRNFTFPDEPGPFTCLVCGQVSVLKSEFWIHVKTQHKGETFKCGRCCDREFKFYSSLRKHIMITEAKKSGTVVLVECEICNKKVNISYIKSHIKRQHEGKVEMVNCEVCGLSMQKHSLRQHMFTHKEATIQCNGCEKMFTTEDKMMRHFKLVHERIRPFKCEVCGKGFANAANLKTHHVVHTGEKPHACELCGGTFTQKAHLNTHIKHVHEGKKRDQPSSQRQDVMCNTCGKLFFNKVTLKTHIEMIHMGIVRYKQKRQDLPCKICGKLFFGRQGLKHHEETHLPDRQTYPCEFCNVVLKCSGNLKRHIRVVHQGDKRYNCDVCKKAFSNSNAVKEHMTMHTGERFKCEICDKSFTQKSSLLAHKRRVHPAPPTYKTEEPFDPLTPQSQDSIYP